MSLYSLKSVLKKLKVLNANRMAQLRDQHTITLDENAEYEDRYKEAEWYTGALDDIEESERLDRAEGDMSLARDTLKRNIQRRLEERFDEILDKTRRLGAGTMSGPDEFALNRGSIKDDLDFEGDTMSQDDRKFLRSCGIKTERGEKWLH